MRNGVQCDINRIEIEMKKAGKKTRIKETTKMNLPDDSNANPTMQSAPVLSIWSSVWIIPNL